MAPHSAPQLRSPLTAPRASGPPGRAGGWPSDRQPQDTPVGLPGGRPASAAPSHQPGAAAGAAGAAPPETAGGVRAWEPTPANPARSRSAVSSPLIKHPRNSALTDVFSSSLSSRDAQDGKAESGSASPGRRGTLGGGCRGKEGWRPGPDRSRDGWQQGRRPGLAGVGRGGGRCTGRPRCVQCVWDAPTRARPLGGEARGTHQALALGRTPSSSCAKGGHHWSSLSGGEHGG